eukprot:6208073-Pleurochrysis_carterae.AAC.2
MQELKNGFPQKDGGRMTSSFKNPWGLFEGERCGFKRCQIQWPVSPRRGEHGKSRSTPAVVCITLDETVERANVRLKTHFSDPFETGLGFSKLALCRDSRRGKEASEKRKTVPARIPFSRRSPSFPAASSPAPAGKSLNPFPSQACFPLDCQRRIKHSWKSLSPNRTLPFHSEKLRVQTACSNCVSKLRVQTACPNCVSELRAASPAACLTPLTHGRTGRDCVSELCAHVQPVRRAAQHVQTQVPTCLRHKSRRACMGKGISLAGSSSTGYCEIEQLKILARQSIETVSAFAHLPCEGVCQDGVARNVGKRSFLATAPHAMKDYWKNGCSRPYGRHSCSLRRKKQELRRSQGTAMRPRRLGTQRADSSQSLRKGSMFCQDEVADTAQTSREDSCEACAKASVGALPGRACRLRIQTAYASERVCVQPLRAPMRAATRARAVLASAPTCADQRARAHVQMRPRENVCSMSACAARGRTAPSAGA